ncbi:MAG: cold shock domain-containing protein [Pseudomonadota bacterium]
MNSNLDAMRTAGIELREVTGELKWYDTAKGFGFVVDSDVGDVLLHKSCLIAAGHTIADEGATVSGYAAKRSTGWQMFELSSISKLDEEARRERAAQKVHAVELTSKWTPVICKWYNRMRGYGFLREIEHPNSTDIFIHHEVLRRHSFVDLQPGQLVDVRWGYGRNGRIAGEIRPAQAGGDA